MKIVIRLVLIFLINIIHAIDEKKMVIVIPSYNNSKWCIKNLDSVMQQNYHNYQVIYIDDCSTDNTYQLVEHYIHNYNCHKKITLFKNEQRQGALANIYRAIHSIDDKCVVILVDGDDWLTNNEVLNRVNQAYANPNVWLTYGQFFFYPENRLGQCRPVPREVIKNNTFREYEWCTTHLRTFYAGLFKAINIQDLYYKKGFFDVTWDRAFMYPMLEMAGEHIYFIPEVLYCYNCDNPANDFKVKTLEQFICCNIICSMEKYYPLEKCPF